MPAGADSVRGTSAVAAIALLVLIPAWIGILLLESTRGDRFADPDDPAVSLRYLAEASGAVVLSGIFLIVVAAAIITAAAAFERVLAGATAPTTATRATAVAAYLAAGLLTLAGALRISAPGTLAYVAGLDVEWGRVGYLVVHIVGTQGAVAGSRVAIGAWMIGVLMLGVRRRILPTGVLVLTVVPLVLLLSVVGPLAAAAFDGGDFDEVAWVTLMLTFLLGVPIWCGTVAGILLARRRRNVPGRTRLTAQA